MKKRITSLVLSAITAISAVTVCPFAISAEETYSYKDSPIYDEIYEITLKNTDAKMAQGSRYARLDDELNDKYVDIFLRRGNRTLMGFSNNNLPIKVYFHQSDDTNYARLWPMKIDPYDVKINYELSEGKTYDDLNEYIQTNYADYNLRVTSECIPLKSYMTTDEEEKVIDKINIKALVQDLYDNNLIASAELVYGSSSGSIMFNEYFGAVSGIYSTEDITTIPEDERITNQDILEWRAKGTVDCHFGMLIAKSRIPDGVEYLDYGEMDKLDYDALFSPDTFGLVPITPENAANVDEKLLEDMYCFAAVPYENTLENHIDLMYRINQEIPIFYGLIGGRDVMGSRSVDGLTIDILNTVDGDANCDDILSIADAAAVLQSICNSDKYPLSVKGTFNAECEGNNNGITVSDAIAIQKKLAGIAE